MRQSVTLYIPHLHPREEEGEAAPKQLCAAGAPKHAEKEGSGPRQSPLRAHEEWRLEVLGINLRNRGTGHALKEKCRTLCCPRAQICMP